MNDFRDPNDPNRGGSGDLISDAGDEIKGMAKDGMRHPSTKPVLIGAGVGAVAGADPAGGEPAGRPARRGGVHALHGRLRPLRCAARSARMTTAR